MYSKYLKSFCQLLGILCILLTLIALISRLILYFFRLFKAKTIKRIDRVNTWAVITGATEGIGLAYARQLAKKGYNLLLISRTEYKLLKVKEDFHKKYGNDRKVRILTIDFNRPNDGIYDEIEDEFKNLNEIQVLVNNVGIVYPNEKPEYFTKIPKLNEVIMGLINVNIIPSTRLTALVLPQMERRGRGIIINLSSMSSLFPVPLLALYSATKIYNNYMSRALQEEYRHKGIVIQCVLPFYVSTQMTHNMNSRSYVPTPDLFVRQALRTIGREETTAGYSVHRILRFSTLCLSIISECLGVDLNMKSMFYRLRGIRHRINEKEALLSPLLSTPLNEEIV